MGDAAGAGDGTQLACGYLASCTAESSHGISRCGERKLHLLSRRPKLKAAGMCKAGNDACSRSDQLLQHGPRSNLFTHTALRTPLIALLAATIFASATVYVNPLWTLQVIVFKAS